ncbi:uncharacterized protein LOC101851830 [Aplysia californica]|uniref:Uncharacterized protein LOC101851830 n=1 Tax=Aplysia californica TaxID=6500 RepID=A0ABM1W0G7_APLCA|nr:uncharacterized protein LOC101851830 [Aplysia californica]
MGPEDNSSVTSLALQQGGLVDDDVLRIFILVFFVVALGTISFFGIVFNAINIIVFIKQGFKDTVNIALFSLAISDLGAVVPLLWESICFNPSFANADLPFDTQDIVYLTAGVVPVYYSVRLRSKFFAQRNTTKIGLVYIPNGTFIEKFSILINAFAQFASFFAVIVSSAILVQSLVRKSKWRQSTSSTAGQESFSNRDKKVVKMILIIAVIFIACFLPSAVTFIAQSITPEYNIVGRFQNMFLLTWAIFTSVAAVNSSVNIFVYYNMSSKYKDILDKMLRLNREKGS